MEYYLNDFKRNNPNPAIDMTGKKINMLTVICRAESKNGRTMWHCKCDCGNEIDVWYAHLKKGQFSCGCYKNKRISERLTKHGKTKTKLFKLWRHMRERCYKKYHKSYMLYGGRGITVCQEWLDDFMNFYNWAMDNGYDENAPNGECTIDRIDVNGNYEPSNCRFVSIKEQCNNKRNNHLLEYQSEKHTISQWSELLEIPYSTLAKRVEAGWSIGQTLGFEQRKGVRVQPKYKSYNEYKLSQEN